MIASSPTLWTTTGIFAATYLGLALGKVPKLRMDRAGIAFVGATLMLIVGVITLDQAVRPDSIDYQTLFLLFGMMVVVGFLRLSGFFAQLTAWSLSRLRTPRGLLAATILLSGLLSAFLVNDVVCLALTPLILHLTRRMRLDPVPHLIALATAANIGSTGTITGNPQNMIIGSKSGISYLHFAAHLTPVALLGLAADFAVIAFVYRNRLHAAAAGNAGDGSAPVPIANGRNGRNNKNGDGVPRRRAHTWLRGKSVVITLLTVTAFFVVTQRPIAVIALAAAAVLLVGRIKPEKVYRQIDWGLLLMFVGLFIVVHAFQLHVVSRWGVERWQFLLRHPVDLMSVASAVLSNLVSNVPAVLLFEPVVRAVPAPTRPTAWLALAMSSTFAGNLTLLGSVANLIVVERARREGVHISFWEYCKAGTPVTILTLLLGIAWLKFVPY